MDGTLSVEDILDLGLDSLVEFLNVPHPFGGLGIHLVILLERNEIEGTKGVLTIHNLQWGLICGPVRGSVVGEFSMG